MSISRHQARSLIRKGIKRIGEGEEIRHLIIVPMMDIVTILLVSFILTASESSALSVSEVNLPGSQSIRPLEEQAVSLTIARDSVLVDGRPVVQVRNGAVDASEKKDGALGMQIPKLSRYLGGVKNAYDQDLTSKGKKPSPRPELLVIADKATPYKLLFEVIVSARAQEAGFRRFRLILLQAHEANVPPG